MSYFEYTADGHIVAEHNGRRALDTRAPMLGLVPAAAINLAGFAISFPDFWKGTIYAQARQTNTNPTYDEHGCATYIGLVGQEWGPSEPAPRNLPDIALGSVPAGTNYLEIWVNLTRTVTPAKLLDLNLVGDFPQGLDVKLDGHSCVLEEMMGVARQFEFVIDGTALLLRRTQSVNDNGGRVSPPAPRVTGSASINNKVFFFPGTNAPEAAGKGVVYGQKIDSKRNANDPSHRPNGYEAGSSDNVACSMSHAGISYASTWVGNIKITPGRLGAA